MSNPYQRPGRYKKTAAAYAASDRQARNQLDFFKSAAEMLNRYDKDDAAFYFEQVEEHLRRGGSLNDPVARILGV
jgi:transcription initiation factor TFIIIB Brf1 subunit/transcription initiation factor TFIIB